MPRTQTVFSVQIESFAHHQGERRSTPVGIRVDNTGESVLPDCSAWAQCRRSCGSSFAALLLHLLRFHKLGTHVCCNLVVVRVRLVRCFVHFSTESSRKSGFRLFITCQVELWPVVRAPLSQTRLSDHSDHISRMSIHGLRVPLFWHFHLSTLLPIPEDAGADLSSRHARATALAKSLLSIAETFFATAIPLHVTNSMAAPSSAQQSGLRFQDILDALISGNGGTSRP